MRRLWLIAAALLLVSAAGAPARAQRDEDEKEHGEKGEHHGRAERWMKRFGLTEEQTKKFHEAQTAGKEAAKPIMEKYKAAQKKLKEQVKSKAVDDEIKKTLEEMTALRKSLHEAVESAKQKAEATLSPTQRAKMILALERGMHRARGSWERRRHGGDDDDDRPRHRRMRKGGHHEDDKAGPKHHDEDDDEPEDEDDDD
ncbi:MAG: hypothetical protein HY078_09695 [Elusimicrobia bacterium]|nr:hypothetical protein [Elusimicrobiota bacterium]